MLIGWDVSIEGGSFLFGGTVWHRQALTAVTELESMVSVQGQIATLDTIRYWLGCYQALLDSRAYQSAQQIAAHEPPPPASCSSTLHRRTLDSLSMPGSTMVGELGVGFHYAYGGANHD